MTEAALQRAVIRLAKLLGWRAVAFRAARTLRGWRTPCMGDGAGWPDLFLLHLDTGRVMFRELKSDGGLLREAQRKWLMTLDDAGQDVDVWNEADWKSGRIERELREGGNG